MRVSAFLGQALAAVEASTVSFSGDVLSGSELKNVLADTMGIVKTRQPKHRGGKAPFRYRTGLTYPHSNTRQRARYARQITAAQIRNA